MMREHVEPPAGQSASPTEQCDVHDVDKLKLFREKRNEWIKWISGDENSISNQIDTMSWTYIVFRMINESRRIAFASGMNSAARNDVFFEFFTIVYMTTQAISIRKLMEPRARTAKRQVISLRILIEDVLSHRSLFTRENFVCFDGAPYDPEPGRRKWFDRIMNNHKQPSAWCEHYHTSGPDAWHYAENRHRLFDQLICASRGPRGRKDLLPDRGFSGLKELLEHDVIERARILCNKRIAHAADEFSRSLSGQGVQGISFNQVEAAHAAMIRVANFISVILLNHTSIGEVPVPQFDCFKYLDCDWLNAAGIERLRSLWDELAAQRERWVRDCLKNFALQECRGDGS